MIHLVLGGARSGKSRYGESLAEPFAQQGHQCVYIATATALDDEMALRIKRHQQDRLDSNINWQLVESPLALACTLKHYDAPNTVLFVDCLTLYLTNYLVACEETHRDGVDDLWQQQKQALMACLASLQGQVILVSNEVGSGIVPLGELSRRFTDEAGWLNQAIAQVADKVTLVVAGLPLELKR